MIYLKLNGKASAIPTDFNDLTFRQYLDIRAIPNTKLIDIAAYFTGFSVEALMASTEVENFYIIIDGLSWVLGEPALEANYRPATIRCADVTYNIPNTIDRCTVAQFEDVRAIMLLSQQDNKLGVDIYPKIIAVFIAPVIFGKYDSDTYEKTVPIIEGLTVPEVIGLGNFFVMKFSDLSNGIRKGLHRPNTTLKKLRLALKNLRHGVFSIH